MCNICPLVLYYTKLANTCQNIIVGLFELIGSLLCGIINCIYKTIVELCNLIQRLTDCINEKTKNSCPKPQCAVQSCEIMCSISCLLLIVVAIFMIIFHTQWLDSLMDKYDDSVKGLKDTKTISSEPSTYTTSRSYTTPSTPVGPGVFRSGQLEEFTINILSDQESYRAREREELREIHNDEKIGLWAELNPKLLDDVYFKHLQETTASANLDPHTNNLHDVKELVKEKQSMTKVLSLLEEILKSMNSKKKNRNTRLSKLFNIDTYFDTDVDQEK